MVADKFKIIFERLKEHTKAKSDADVARGLGISPQALSAFKKQGKFPSDLLIKYCLMHQISIDWLITGEGPMKRGYPPHEEKPSMGAEELAMYGDKIVKVYIYSLAGAGSLKELTEHEPIGTIFIPKEFSWPSLAPIKIRGHGMEPTIYEGAFVGVDRYDKQIVSGEIYAVWMPYEGAVIKRLFMDIDKVHIKSDNQMFPSMSILYKELDENFILGRVKWVIQKL